MSSAPIIDIISPHGMCAGVHAAVAKALAEGKKSEVPLYCLHELVHNEIVIDELKALGFIFVDSVEQIPVGETVVFSAHGVSPKVRKAAAERKLKIIDTTCPFVAKVHRAAKNFAEKNLPVVILGDKKHIEVQGIAGEVESVGAEAYCGFSSAMENPRLPKGAKIAVVAQTTMNAEKVAAETEELSKKFKVENAARVCGATDERQEAVRHYAANALPGTGVLVLGSRTSANSKRLAEVAAASGLKTFFAGSLDELEKIDFSGVERLGVTSGASTPERFFNEAVRRLRRIPEHIAIIMDGNGRWATSRGKPRGEGHRAGAKTLGDVLDWCGEKGVKYLTVYAFSTENWTRPKTEVDGLMSLFAVMLKKKERDFIKNQVRFRMIGRRGDLSKSLLSVIENLERKTQEFEKQFIVAISYGGRAEIVDAVNSAIAASEPVTEETFRKYLYAGDVPDPDLVIRTSGECRTSNFLLWESAYSEYYFTDVLWPDFSEEEFDKAISSYAGRNRRRGGV
jgi:undecaprenyl diphosphate synthase